MVGVCALFQHRTRLTFWKVELYVPENEASGSQYVEEGEQAESTSHPQLSSLHSHLTAFKESYNTYSDDRVYRTAETGYQYPPDPAQNTSSVATGSWNSVYAPNVPSIEQSQSYQWSSTPQYQNQYQNQYQGQYQTEDSQAWPAGYYASPTYQTASSTEYDASNTYTGGDTSTQDYTQNEWDEAAHYE